MACKSSQVFVTFTHPVSAASIERLLEAGHFPLNMMGSRQGRSRYPSRPP
jgi:hypothetical protein